MDKNKYAIVVLAAGGSERLGRPKQLLKFNNTTLLNNTIEQASSVDKADLYVALGGNQSEIRPTISDDVVLLDIPNWQKGFGTTISDSLKQLDLESYEAIILSVCDQPFIASTIFDDLIDAFEEGNASIVLSKYKIASGPPTLFSWEHFDDLLALKGEKGARDINKENINSVKHIPFQNGFIDIDTEYDLNNLRLIGN